MAIHRKKEFTETALEKAQLMDFPEKWFKSAVLNILKEEEETMDKELKETRSLVS
jgi:hypothetical protein